MTEQEKIIDLITEVRDNCYCQAQEHEDSLLFEKAHILDSAVEKLQRSRWVFCTDRMPEIGKRVLICTRKGYVSMATYQKDDMAFDHLYDGRPEEQAVTVKDYSFAQTSHPEDSIAAVNSPCFSQSPRWESDPVIAWMELPESCREEKEND